MIENEKLQIIDIIIFVGLFHVAVLVSNTFIDKYGKTWNTLYISSMIIVSCGLFIWYVIKRIIKKGI